MMKNAFFFILKAFLFLRYFLFLRFISKFLTSQPGKKIIAIHTLPNVCSKGNEAMEYGQFIEYNIGNIFLQKSCRKWGRETRCFLYFKKLYMRWKQLISTLVSLYSGILLLGHTIKTNRIKVQTVELEICSALIF